MFSCYVHGWSSPSGMERTGTPCPICHPVITSNSTTVNVGVAGGVRDKYIFWVINCPDGERRAFETKEEADKYYKGYNPPRLFKEV